MFKKLLIILLMAVYGVSSSGFTLYMHYCCGKLDKVDLSYSDNKKCPLSFQASDKNCCANKQVEIKIKSDHQPEYAANKVVKLFSANYIAEESIITSFNTLPYSILSYSSTSPPLKKDVLLYKLNCVYNVACTISSCGCMYSYEIPMVVSIILSHIPI